jgi:hypothetical protein
MSTRSRALARASVAVVLLAMGASAGCQLTSRALGEDCLKDQDCLSGICSQLKCAAAPPLLSGIPQGTPDTGAPPQDSAAPPPDTGAPDVAVANDTGTSPPDSGNDSAGDASQDATSE